MLSCYVKEKRDKDEEKNGGIRLKKGEDNLRLNGQIRRVAQNDIILFIWLERVNIDSFSLTFFFPSFHFLRFFFILMVLTFEGYTKSKYFSTFPKKEWTKKEMKNIFFGERVDTTREFEKRLYEFWFLPWDFFKFFKLNSEQSKALWLISTHVIFISEIISLNIFSVMMDRTPVPLPTSKILICFFILYFLKKNSENYHKLNKEFFVIVSVVLFFFFWFTWKKEILALPLVHLFVFFFSFLSFLWLLFFCYMTNFPQMMVHQSDIVFLRYENRIKWINQMILS